MTQINTMTDAMCAIAVALEDRSVDDLYDIEEQIEGWLIDEDERDAWTALLRSAETALVYPELARPR